MKVLLDMDAIKLAWYKKSNIETNSRKNQSTISDVRKKSPTPNEE